MRKHHPKIQQVQKKSKLQQLIKKLQSNKKIYYTSIVGIVLIVIVSSLLIRFNLTHSSTDTIDISSRQVVDNIEFTDGSLNNNKLIVVVHNMNNTTYSLSTIDVEFYDSESNLITTISGYIGNSILADESHQLVVETDEDLSNAKSVKYIINK